MESDSAFIIGSLLTIIGFLIKDTFTVTLGSFMVFITIVSYIITCRYNYNVIANNETNINSIEESKIEQL
jgi:riboflavin transporter FmnP